jgi:hypothetical protein
VTWWEKSAPFFSYIDRCQFMLQQGHFAADVLYYYGDHVPNFTQHKRTDPAHCQPGYDYDVITAEALINRTSVKDGKIFLPDGINYRVLVLPERDQISLPVLKKIAELVKAGATIIGPKPTRGETLENFAATDAEVKKIADELWSDKAVPGGGAVVRPVGKGRVFANTTAREVLAADNVIPDFAFTGETDQPLDYLHRQDSDTDIYFIANRTNQATATQCAFRVGGKAPELWNPVTGERRFAEAYSASSGRTVVPLEFGPCGSWFVVFREPAAAHPAVAKANAPELTSLQTITGAWTVHFDSKWGGPETAQFDSLTSWPTRPETGIKFYSGTATYEKTFVADRSKFKTQAAKLILDLGNVREIAEVKVNGKSCGIVWCPPWRVDVTSAVKPGENSLQIEVVNFWPNRIIGDASLPEAQRLTRTNIRKLTAKTPLEPAGLLGPVQILEADQRR